MKRNGSFKHGLVEKNRDRSTFWVDEQDEQGQVPFLLNQAPLFSEEPLQSEQANKRNQICQGVW